MRYVIHDAASGVILRHGQGTAEDIAAQPVPSGHAVLTLPDEHAPIDDTIHQVAAGAITARPAVVMSSAEALRRLRRGRDHRLAATDWTQLPDVPLALAARNAWAAYRQALRDLPTTTQDIASPVWPEPPQRTEA